MFFSSLPSSECWLQLPSEPKPNHPEQGSHVKPSSLADQGAGGSALSTLSTLFTSDRYMGTGVERSGLVHSHLNSWVDMFVAKTWHGLDWCKVPTKTAYHMLEGGRSLAASSWGEMARGLDREKTLRCEPGRTPSVPVSRKGKDTFPVVVLAAPLVPSLSDLLLGVQYLTPDLFLQQLLAKNYVSTHPQWLLLQGLQCLLSQLSPL